MNSTTHLSDRTALVTGAVGDIGSKYVNALVSAGANVVAGDLAITAQAGQTVAQKVSEVGPGSAVFTPLDVTCAADLDDAVHLAVDTFGGLDVLVNNAALYRALGTKRALTDLTTDDWDRVLTVNVRGSWQAIKAVAPAMTDRGGGRIINISSIVSRTGAAGFAHYVASKSAVEGLTRAAARELGAGSITVNALAPGLVSDEATWSLNDQEYIDSLAQARALGREMHPDDLVGAMLFLAGPASDFITGQTIIVDGGQTFS